MIFVVKARIDKDAEDTFVVSADDVNQAGLLVKHVNPGYVLLGVVEFTESLLRDRYRSVAVLFA